MTQRTTDPAPEEWLAFHAYLGGRSYRELDALFRDLRSEYADDPTPRKWARQSACYFARSVRACQEGRPLDQLRIYSPDEEERFWAQTIDGPDGHVYWQGSQTFRDNGGGYQNPQRWVWQRTHGKLDYGEQIVSGCGTENCVAAEHLRHRPRRERAGYGMSDEQVIGGLQALALRLGHAPSARDWNEAGHKLGAAGVAWRFGKTWPRALAAAGLRAQRPPGLCGSCGCAHADKTEGCRACKERHRKRNR